MSLLSSLNTGVSGLNASGQELSVIGNNIANMNTTGFKGSTISFGDLLDQTISGLSGTSQVGLGVSVGAITPELTQGSLQTTSNPLDIAVDGQGFFMVDNNGVTDYTRDGEFQTNAAGDITTASGQILQGYLANATGTITGQLGDIQLQANTSLPKATTTANLDVNLDSGSAAPAAAWNAAWEGTATPPATDTYNNMTSVTAYDSEGNAHSVDVYFINTSTAANPNTWTANYVYQDSSGNYQSAGTQNLGFNSSGDLTSLPTSALALNWGGGVANGAVTIGLTGTTQVAGSFRRIKCKREWICCWFAAERRYWH